MSSRLVNINKYQVFPFKRGTEHVFMNKKIISEFLGTMLLVGLGCGVGVFSKGDYYVVSLSFAVLTTLLYQVTIPVSGYYLNPAVVIALAVAGRLQKDKIWIYISAQLAGSVTGICILKAVMRFAGCNIAAKEFWQNSYGMYSEHNYSLFAAYGGEMVFTFLLVMIILALTEQYISRSVGNVIIGLTVFLIHIGLLPITRTSLNPARSLAPALFAGDTALRQLWIFIAAPLSGGLLAAFAWRLLFTLTQHDFRKK